MVGEINDAYVKVAKLSGEFMWHHHDNEDDEEEHDEEDQPRSGKKASPSKGAAASSKGATEAISEDELDALLADLDSVE